MQPQFLAAISSYPFGQGLFFIGGAADAVVDAVKDGPFLSVEDFSSRTRVNGTICALMSDLGLLKDLPQSNQLSLFDL